MSDRAERARRAWAGLGGEGLAPDGMVGPLVKLYESVLSGARSAAYGEMGHCADSIEAIAEQLGVDTSEEELLREGSHDRC